MGEGCKMCDVLSWRQPATAAASLMSFNLLYLLVFGLGKTLLSMGSWLCLAFLGLGLCLRLLGVTNEKSSSSSSSSSSHEVLPDAASVAGGGVKVTTVGDGSIGGGEKGASVAMGKEDAEGQQRVYEVISRETMEEHITVLYGSVNFFLSGGRDVLLWKDWMTSLRYFGGIWVIGAVCSFFSFPVIVFLLVWSAFLFTAMRRIYLDSIRPLVTPHVKMARQMVCRVLSAVPRMDDALNKSKKKV